MNNEGVLFAGDDEGRWCDEEGDAQWLFIKGDEDEGQDDLGF